MCQELKNAETNQTEYPLRYRQGVAATLLASALLALCGFATSAHAEAPADKSALFDKVFGSKDATAETSIPVELMFDGRESGLATMLINNDGAFRVDIEALIQAVEAVATEQTLVALRAVAAESQLVRPDTVSELGIHLSYEPATLRLTIAMDPELRSRTNIAIKDTRNNQTPQAADFSLYTNFSGNGNFSHSSTGRPGGWRSVNVQLETVAQLHGWVLESEAFYQSTSANRWRRGGVRLIHDNVDRGTRLVVGDQLWPGQPLMGGHQLAGVSLFKNFDIQPYTVTHPSGYQEFYLDNPSTVEIYVNESLTRTLRLDPGAYSVDDFPLAQGSNDFRMRIIDSFGQESVFATDIYSASTLLAQSVTEFALSAGLRSSYLMGKLDYDIEDPLLAGLYRRGLSDTLTLGFAGSMSTKSVLMNGQAVLATKIGNFTINVGASNDDRNNPGVAAQFGYRAYQKLRSGLGERSWDFSTLHLSSNYIDAMAGPNNIAPSRWSLRVAQPLTTRSNVSLSTSFQRRAGSKGTYNVALSYSYRLRSGLNLRFSAYSYPTETSTTDNAVSLSYSYPFGGGKQNLQGDYDSRNNRRSTNWSHSPPNSDLGPSGSLGYREDRDNRFLNGLLALNGSRFEASVNHYYSDDLSQDSPAAQTTAVNFSTAIALAGGRVALTRQIADSFAIAIPHENYANFDIGLRHRNSDLESVSGLLGAAISSRLTSYETHQLEVNVDKLPLGYDLRNTNPAVTPRYRSGVIITVGNAASIILRGRLLSEDGNAHQLQSGMLKFLGDEDSAAIRFFSNRNGKFTVSGLQPGTYEISLQSSGSSTQIQVPADAKGVLSLGDIPL